MVVCVFVGYVGVPRPIRYASALGVSAAAFPKEYSALLAVPDLAISKSSRVPDGALGYQPEPPFSNVPVSEVRNHEGNSLRETFPPVIEKVLPSSVSSTKVMSLAPVSAFDVCTRTISFPDSAR